MGQFALDALGNVAATGAAVMVKEVILSKVETVIPGVGAALSIAGAAYQICNVL